MSLPANYHTSTSHRRVRRSIVAPPTLAQYNTALATISVVTRSLIKAVTTALHIAAAEVY